MIKYTRRIKVELWKLGLLPGFKCPICSKKLNGHGYDSFGESPGYYTCSDEKCEFNKNG